MLGSPRRERRRRAVVTPTRVARAPRRRALRHGRPQRLRGLPGDARRSIAGAGSSPKFVFVKPPPLSILQRATFVRPGHAPCRPRFLAPLLPKASPGRSRRAAAKRPAPAAPKAQPCSRASLVTWEHCPRRRRRITQPWPGAQDLPEAPSRAPSRWKAFPIYRATVLHLVDRRSTAKLYKSDMARWS